MARRKRLSKPVVAVMGVALAFGAGAVVYKMLGGSGSETPSVAQNDAPGIVAADAPKTPTTNPALVPNIKLAAVKIDVPSPATQPVKFGNTPATRPASEATPHFAPPAAPIGSGDAKSLVDQADAKRKSDDLLAARRLLVQAIDTKKLSLAEHDDVLRRLNEINDVVVFSNRKFISDEYAIQHVVKPGELMQKIAASYDITWKFIGRLNGISDPRKLQAGKSLKIIKGPFHAMVSKSNYTLDLYIGKPTEPGAVFVKRLRVGLGESDSTPTGEWKVDTKLENPRYYNPRSEGPRVIEPDDPKNPLGERWIALLGATGQAVGKTSYGIHGTIEPDSIGQKKSLGCIRMLNEDVELVYDMLIPGKSTVTVVE